MITNTLRHERKSQHFSGTETVFRKVTVTKERRKRGTHARLYFLTFPAGRSVHRQAEKGEQDKFRGGCATSINEDKPALPTH